jgi:hypothetical protein
MYKRFFIYFFLLITGSLFGQSKGYHSIDFWKKYTEALAFDLKLNPISIEKTNFYFRFWNIGQVIDIWKDNSNFIHGEITNYAKEYDEMNMGKRTFYSSKLPIKPGIASDIYQLILKSGLTSIPTADSIDRWGKNTDGFTHIAECIDSSEYSFKCYVSPDKQGSLKEAMIIQSFIEKLDHILKLKKRYKSFSVSVPFWCYTKGTTEVICREK